MLNHKIEKFLEDNNLTYLYLLLANLEAERLSNLPYTVKKNFKDKIKDQEKLQSCYISSYLMVKNEHFKENREI